MSALDHHGWLIFMDLASFSPFLLNPFTKARIQLPSLEPVFGIHRIQKSINQAGVSHVAMFYPSLNSFRETCISTENLLVYIPKAILTAEPVGNYGVVVLCRSGETKKFAYYRNGDSSWTEVINRARKGILLNTYEDIISHENKLYALDYWSFSIDTWDLRLCQASETLTTAFPDEMMQDKLVRDLFPKKFYLAESGGEILLVAKFRDFHHKTKVFQVFKLDLVRKKWVRVNSLGDRSLFLGGNHSISIPNKNLMSCKGKSLIYFSDDLWEYEEYNGHDNGIYSLEDGRFLRVYEADTVRTSPFWIVPTLCKLNS